MLGDPGPLPRARPARAPFCRDPTPPTPCLRRATPRARRARRAVAGAGSSLVAEPAAARRQRRGALSLGALGSPREWRRLGRRCRRPLIYAVLSCSWSARGCCRDAPCRARTGCGRWRPGRPRGPPDVRPLGVELRAGRRRGRVPAFFQFTRAALPDVPLWNPHIMAGRPFLADAQSAVFSPFTAPALRRAVLEVAGRHGRAQAVRGRVRHLPPRPGARDALRRRAAGRGRVRVRHLLHRLAGLAAHERLPADPVASCCSPSW